MIVISLYISVLLLISRILANPLETRDISYDAFPEPQILGRTVDPANCYVWAQTYPWTTCSAFLTLYGVTMENLFTMNPSVDFDCFDFAPGTEYCIQMYFPLPASTDGTCGNLNPNVTCVGSTFGDCCGPSGTCGSTDAYCAIGNCQEGNCPGLGYTIDGNCGLADGYLLCGGQWGNYYSNAGKCGSTNNECGIGNCQYGACVASTTSTSSTKSTSATSLPSPFSPSPDGSCGYVNQYSCEGTQYFFGYCCNAAGYCGATEYDCTSAYGCQPEYGLCDITVTVTVSASGASHSSTTSTTSSSTNSKSTSSSHSLTTSSNTNTASSSSHSTVSSSGSTSSKSSTTTTSRSSTGSISSSSTTSKPTSSSTSSNTGSKSSTVSTSSSSTLKTSTLSSISSTTLSKPSTSSTLSSSSSSTVSKSSTSSSSSSSSTSSTNLVLSSSTSVTSGLSSSTTSTSTSGSSTPTLGIKNTVGGYYFVGCQTEGNGVRTLSGNMLANDSMTLEMCASFCQGYAYFGVEYGRECWCGNAVDPSSSVAALTDCSFLCPGNAYEYCGAGNRLELYCTSPTTLSVSTSASITSSSSIQSTSIPTTSTQSSSLSSTISSSTKLSSTTSTSTQHSSTSVTSTISTSSSTVTTSSSSSTSTALSSVTKSSTTSSSSSSTSKISSSTVSSTGTSSKSSSSSKSTTSSTSSTSSSKSSSTTSSSTRSSSTTSSAQPTQTVPISVPSVGNFSLIGCYEEPATGRALSYLTANDNMTVEYCMSLAAGYNYAGVEYGRECWYDDVLNSGAVNETGFSNCNMLCGGNSLEYCGGSSHLTLYEFI